MSLPAGLAILALAVLAGGIAAIWRDHGRHVMPGLSAFAMVASAAIALLHLLPESFAEIGWGAPLAALAAFFGPFVLERLVPHDRASEDNATLVVGYSAVLVHQAGEGTAVASLARTNALGTSIVLAIAAHTAPLAMVVAIQALESAKALPQGRTRAALALLGCVVATTTGALSLDLVGAARIAVMKPWLVAAVAGLLLHALSHVPKRAEEATGKHKLVDLVASQLGLAVAIVSLEKDGWVSALGWPSRLLGVVLLAAIVALNVYWPRKVAERRARSAERDPRAG